MSAALAFVDAVPVVKPRGDHIELHLVSGDGTHSFVLTRHAASRFEGLLARSIAQLYAGRADIVPIRPTKERSRGKGSVTADGR